MSEGLYEAVFVLPIQLTYETPSNGSILPIPEPFAEILNALLVQTNETHKYGKKIKNNLNNCHIHNTITLQTHTENSTWKSK